MPKNVLANRIVVATFVALAVIFGGGVMTTATAQNATEQATEAKDESTAKERDIRRFLKLTGASQLARQTLRQMVAVYRRTMPDVPETFWKELAAEFDADDLVEQLVPVYDKHLTHDDLKALIAFYESPAGRRYSKALPKIASESEAVGRRWGEEVAKRVNARLEKEGYAPKP